MQLAVNRPRQIGATCIVIDPNHPTSGTPLVGPMTQQLYQMDELDIEFITHVEKLRENLKTEKGLGGLFVKPNLHNTSKHL